MIMAAIVVVALLGLVLGILLSPPPADYPVRLP
jgi:hypothetical protein